MPIQGPKIMGWMLLLAGLAVIAFALFSSYNIFTAKTAAPALFKAEPQSSVIVESDDPEAQMGQMVSAELKKALAELVPEDFFTKSVNLITWSAFAFLLITAGVQISGLGIKLLKD